MLYSIFGRANSSALTRTYLKLLCKMYIYIYVHLYVFVSAYVSVYVCTYAICIYRPRTAVVQVLGIIFSHDPDLDTVSENRHSGRSPHKQYSVLGLYGSFYYPTRPIIVSLRGNPPQEGASNGSALPKPKGPKTQIIGF